MSIRWKDGGGGLLGSQVSLIVRCAVCCIITAPEDLLLVTHHTLDSSSGESVSNAGARLSICRAVCVTTDVAGSRLKPHF